jgi:hypothetical protein
MFPGFEPMLISRVLELFLYQLTDIYVRGEFSEPNLILKRERLTDA